MMKNFAILLLLLIFNACNKSDKVIDIPDKYYNVPVEMRYKNKIDLMDYEEIHISDTTISKNTIKSYEEPDFKVCKIEDRKISVDYEIDVSANQYVTDKIYYMFLTKKSSKMFKNSDIEILFTNTATNKNGNPVPLNTLISMQRINNKLRSLFVSWYPKFSNQLGWARNSSAIDKNTDYVFSNLPYGIFKKYIYDIDSLHYTNIEEDTLNVDDFYYQTELDFYRSIRTSQFELGGNIIFNFQWKHELFLKQSCKKQ